MTAAKLKTDPTVAFLAHSLNTETGGGSNHTLHHLACSLVNAGCRVQIITLNPRLNRVSPDAPYAIVEHRLSDTFLSIPKQLLLTRLMFRWQKGVDLFQIEAPSLLMAGGLYRTLGGRTPVVARLHSYSWFCPNVSRMNSTCFRTCSLMDRIRHRDESLARKVLLAPARAAADLLRQAVMRRVDGIISLSDPASEIESHLGLHGNYRIIVPPARTNTASAPPATTGPRKTEPGPLRLLYVGRLTPEKGVDVLLRAVAGLKVPVSLDIVGAGPEMSALEALANRMGIARDVTFHGWLSQDKLPAFYNRASLFIHPGRWPEPAGRTVIDALAAGLPLIVSDVGGPPWIAGNAGLTFRPDDPDDLCSKIETLAADPARMKELADLAPARVAGVDDNEVLSRVLGMYERVSPAFSASHLTTVAAGEPGGAA